MSDLVVRKLQFNFDGVEFDWHPGNQPFGMMMMNAVTFQVIGFEHYMCKAMRDAEKFITDLAILAESRTFNAQEMVHSLAHKKHIKALMTRYPGLQEVLGGSVARYDELYKSEDLHFHMAYAPNIEAIFIPTMSAGPATITASAGIACSEAWIATRCRAMRRPPWRRIFPICRQPSSTSAGSTCFSKNR